MEAEINGFQRTYEGQLAERDRVSDELRTAERNMQNLNSSNADQLQLFGQGVRETVAEIERQSRSWRGQKPIGPLGKYIKLKDPRWGRVVEGVLGATLNAFLVETVEDEYRLRDILKAAR